MSSAAFWRACPALTQAIATDPQVGPGDSCVHAYCQPGVTTTTDSPFPAPEPTIVQRPPGPPVTDHGDTP
jgi:hypothetical protein